MKKITIFAVRGVCVLTLSGSRKLGADRSN